MSTAIAPHTAAPAATGPATDTAASTAASTAAPRVAATSTAQLRALVLTVGPLVTWALLMYAAARAPYADTFAHYAAWAAVLGWSPLPFSLPAVLLDQDRDEAQAGVPAGLRALTLVPLMLTRSPARVEFALSLLGWASLVFVTVS